MKKCEWLWVSISSTGNDNACAKLIGGILLSVDYPISFQVTQQI